VPSVHYATSKIRYTASLAPLDNLSFSRFILDILPFRWEVVLWRKERGSFDSFSTALPSNQFLGFPTLTNDIPLHPGSTYSMLRQATLWKVVYRGQGKLFYPFPIHIRSRCVIRSRRVIRSFTDPDVYTRFFILIGHSTTKIFLSSVPCSLSNSFLSSGSSSFFPSSHHVLLSSLFGWNQ
jgi:hypothetical protein